MKYLVLIGGGLSDQPIAERDNQTPLQLANTPNLDRLAQTGRAGAYNPLPESLPAGPEVSLLGLLGYDPVEYASGPGHYLAKALKVPVGEGEMPLCCDFIILQSSHNDMILKDFTADRLSGEDSATLIAALKEWVVNEDVSFYSGGGHNNLMVMKTDPFPGRLQPPMELVGEGIRKHIPQEKPYRELIHLMNEAQIILHNHPLNRQRAADSADAVNSVWFWGNGQSKPLPEFEKHIGKKGAVITASPLFKGIALEAGMHVPEVEGVTGFLDTRYEAKVDATLAALETHDIVYTHVGAGEPVSLQGMIDDKVDAIEDFDEKIVGPLLQQAEMLGNVRVLVTENHMSSVDIMRYKKSPVPYVIYPGQVEGDAPQGFDEELISNGNAPLASGQELIRLFINEAG